MNAGLFDNYAIGFFEKHPKNWIVKKRFFETLEQAKEFYFKALKHNHDKTLYKIPKTDEEKEKLNSAGGYKLFIIASEG